MWGSFLRRVLAASFGRALARVLLVTMAVGALPMLLFGPLLALRLATRPVGAYAPLPLPGGRATLAACVGDGADPASPLADCAGVAGPPDPAVTPAAGATAAAAEARARLLRWMALPGIVMLAAGLPLLLGRRAARLREEYEPLPEGTQGVWSPERRQRPLGAEPAFGWLPAGLRAALTWQALPQAAFSTFACGLLMGRAGVELTLGMVLAVQTAAYGFFVLGDGAVRRGLGQLLVRLQLRRAVGRVDSVTAAVSRPPGSLLRLRGRVRTRRRVAAVVGEGAAAARISWLRARVPRRTLAGAWRLVDHHLTDEAAFDFELGDESGQTLLVDVSDSAWLVRRPLLRRLSAAVFARLPRGPLHPGARVWGAERLLRDGDVVEVVGFLDAMVNPALPRLGREPPLRPALRAGRGRPLLIL